MNEALKLTDQEKVEHVARMVRELLTEHEMAGAFFLAAPTHCAEAIMLDSAPWLRVQLEVDKKSAQVMGVRMRSKLDEYKALGLNEADALAAQKRDAEYTLSALSFFGTHMGQFALLSLELDERTRRHFDAVTKGKRIGNAWGKKPS